MLKKRNLFILFIILNIIIYLLFSYLLKPFNYSTILVKFENHGSTKQTLLDPWFTKFENEINSVDINTKKSSFIVFKNIQKWDIRDNVILHERIFNKNINRIIQYLEEKIDIDKNSYIFMQYFSSNKERFEKNIKVIENKIFSTNLEFQEECEKATKYHNYHLAKFGDLEFSGATKLFFEGELQARLNSIKYSMEASCLKIDYKNLSSNKIQKYNIVFLSFLISVMLILTIFFIVSLFNEYKKR